MKKIIVFLIGILFVLGFDNVNASELEVARINDKMYKNLDSAINEAIDNDTIILLSNTTTTGINLNKNLTIKSEEGNHYTIDFIDNGIGIWGKKLTFEDVDVNMNSIGSTPYGEWNWMTISAGINSELNLINTNMVLDGINTDNKHAIYFCGNDKLNLVSSTLIIKNYTQDALEWDGGNGEYNVNMTDSTFVSDNNRSGFTGVFVAFINNSNVDVINSTGNGSNGTHFDITSSKVNFNNNKSHGLSAGRLSIDNSVINANNNGANGIYTADTFRVINNSEVIVTGNDCSISSKWTQPGAVRIGGKNSIVDASSKFIVTDNNGSGLYLTANAELTLETGIITRNVAKMLGQGGGIYNNGIIVINDGVEIHNNKASLSADDIYNLGTLNLPEVTKTNLVLDREDGTVLNDCDDIINGWYLDEENSRWNAHAEEINVIPFTEGTSIKAAHNLVGKVNVYYVDEEGNQLIDTVTIKGYVGEEYQTVEEEIDDYVLVKVVGDKLGKYEIDDIDVTYVYTKIGKGGDEVEIKNAVEVLPPQTGNNKDDNSFSVLFISIVIGLYLFVKSLV